MFETYYPFITIALLVVLVLSVWNSTSVLKGIRSYDAHILQAMLGVQQSNSEILESLAELNRTLDDISRAQSEIREKLHDLAIVFVPRLRPD